MSRQKKWIISIIVVVAIIAVLIASFEGIMRQIGNNELYEIAIAKGYCKTQSCDEGIQRVTDILVKQSGIEAEKVPWCMAANRIYFADFSFANAAKNKFAEWMYQSCERGELTLDDANITIGDHD